MNLIYFDLYQSTRLGKFITGKLYYLPIPIYGTIILVSAIYAFDVDLMHV